MRRVVMLAASSVAAATACEAAAHPVAEITNPVWRAQPTGQEASAAYPMRAMANEKIGVAVVRCEAQSDGKLAACSLVCETPKNWGFGKGALSLTKRYRLEPTLADGRSVAGGWVTLPFHFNPPFLAPVPRCDAKG